MADRLRFELKGKPENDGQITVGDFTRFLETVSASLAKIEADLGAPNSTVFRISDLRFSSAVVEVEAAPRKAGRVRSGEVLKTFERTVAALERGTALPKGLRPETVQQVAEIVRPLKGSVSRLTIGSRRTGFTVSPVVAERAARLLKKPEAAIGEESGFLDALNVHDELIFYLYPSGFSERIPCYFHGDLLPFVRPAVKQYVTVHGRFLYPADGLFPSRIDVESLELHPASDDAPTLLSLVGAAPGLTGGLGSVEYVRRLRDAEA
jgi:hypothetical protein